MSSPSSGLPISEAAALGALHGPAELLPISSSGHIAVVPWLLGWSYRELDDELRKSFEVALHAGTAVALLIVLRAELGEAVHRIDRRCVSLIALSLTPPTIVGYALEREIEHRLGTPATTAAGLLAGAAVMAWADRAPETRHHEQVNSGDAIWLGIAQACALIPGVSRNGATLAAARLRGFTREDANRLSRHVALPVIAGAALLKGIRLHGRGFPPGTAVPFTVGAGASFASTIGSRWLIRRLERHATLLPYAIYRATIAAIVLARLTAPGATNVLARLAGPGATNVLARLAGPGATNVLARLRARCIQRPRAARRIPSIEDNHAVSSAYAAAGVDTFQADRGVAALVEVLNGIDPGRSPLALPLPGHYASVLRVAPGLGIALATDSVGSKVIVAEQVARFDTIGIDCVAMNVNDLICVGAEPLALLDYVAVERAEPELLRKLAIGLRTGAELAGVEIPGGEVCQLPEVIRGHPSPHGFDLVGSAFGTVALDEIVDGRRCRPGDALIGLPSSGVHANGLTLARTALLDRGGFSLDATPPELSGATVGDGLLEPTTIYVRAILELLRSEIPVHGLAHITGGGVLNLLRIGTRVGYEISSPLPVTPVFDLIAEHGKVATAEMWEVFNMGCGFCVITLPERASAAVALLARHHPGADVIGRLTDEAGQVVLPTLGLAGDSAGLESA